MARRRAYGLALTAVAVVGACSYDFEAFDPRLGGSAGGAVTGSGTDTGTSTSTGVGGGGSCTPGETAPCYSGAEGTEDVGVCHGGITTCDDDGAGFGACEDEVVPIAEDCNTPFDDDCDGEVNEADASCQCTPGAITDCYGGDPATEGVGNCFAGQQVCQESGTAHGPCFAQSLPSHEDCATVVDDDCDDTANDHCAVWSRRFGGSYDQIPRAVAVDGSDDVVLVGSHRYHHDYGGGTLSSDTNGDVLVLKLDSSGTHVFSQVYGDGAYQEAFAVAVDDSDAIYVAGDFDGDLDFGNSLPVLTSQGNRDVFVAKLAADGTPQWAVSFGDADNDEVYSMAVDSAGNAIVTGVFGGSIDFGSGAFTAPDAYDDGYVVKLASADGAHLWSYQFGGLEDDVGHVVATDSSGAFYLTGATDWGVDFGGGLVGDGSGQDAFVVKFDAANAHVWSFGISGSGREEGEGLAVDSAGNVWAAGDFDGNVILGSDTIASVGSDDFWVAKLDPGDGSMLWSSTFGGEGDEDCDALAANGAGAVLLGGAFERRMDLGDGELIPAADDSRDDWFIAELDGTGAVQYSRRFGGVSAERLHAIAADSTNHWIITGYCYYSIDLGNGLLTSGSSDDICVGKIAP